MSPADLIKRFTEALIETRLRVSAVSIRVRTNRYAVANLLFRLAASRVAGAPDVVDFVRRVVAESEDLLEVRHRSHINHLSHDGLPFMDLGRRSIVARDGQARPEICFISQKLVSGQKAVWPTPALI